MSEVRYIPVTTMDASSGRVHRRVEEVEATGRVRRVLVDERCNLDDAGSYVRVVEAELEPGTERCRYCFPAEG